jgi:hypothetical protein|tara:strand:+ start:21 stop:602 length:582 start_codon:yes stop_codon:yes gene_type:complete
MENKITFGVPSKLRRKEEFNEVTPALRIEAFRGKGTGRKIFINTLGLELIGVEPGQYVSIGYSEDGKYFIAPGYPEEANSFKLTSAKDYSFSNSKMYDHLIDTHFNGDNSITYDVKLVNNEEFGAIEIIFSFEEPTNQTNLIDAIEKEAQDEGSDGLIGSKEVPGSWDKELYEIENDVDGFDELSKQTLAVDC